MMNSDLEALKAELERFSRENDSSDDPDAPRMRNITRDTGEFLGVLVRATRARRILEIGTSNGYSTLWLAEAASASGGTVTTVEASDYKAGLAAANFARAGLAGIITLVQGEARTALGSFMSEDFDFIFLDSDRSAYPRWWPDVRRLLHPGGTLAADNALSHPNEMAPFIALIKNDPDFTTSVVPVGKGEFLAVKARPENR